MAKTNGTSSMVVECRTNDRSVGVYDEIQQIGQAPACRARGRERAESASASGAQRYLRVARWRCRRPSRSTGTRPVRECGVPTWDDAIAGSPFEWAGRLPVIDLCVVNGGVIERKPGVPLPKQEIVEDPPLSPVRHHDGKPCHQASPPPPVLLRPRKSGAKVPQNFRTVSAQQVALGRHLSYIGIAGSVPDRMRAERTLPILCPLLPFHHHRHTGEGIPVAREPINTLLLCRCASTHSASPASLTSASSSSSECIAMNSYVFAAHSASLGRSFMRNELVPCHLSSLSL